MREEGRKGGIKGGRKRVFACLSCFSLKEEDIILLLFGYKVSLQKACY
jgi:hypothetical protein